MPNLRRRLHRLELRREEERSFQFPPGEARRLLEEKIAAVRLRLGMDSQEYVASDVTAEEVKAMIHAHLEANRVRRDLSSNRRSSYSNRTGCTPVCI